MINVNSIKDDIERVDRRYDGDNDIIPGAPVVTWTDRELLELVRRLTDCCMDLQSQITEMGRPKLHRYYFINRPPFVGTHPAGAVAQQAWDPVMFAPDVEGRKFHGYADYAQPIGFEQIWKYELYPQNLTELMFYNAWREENSK